MPDLRSNFINWYYNEFTNHPLYLKMVQTVENSPWHRERNVAVHTDMVVGQYLSIMPDEWNQNAHLAGAFACAFHDVGKPDKEEVKFKEERGEYRAYNGHETYSARLWEDYAASNFEQLRSKFGMGPLSIFRTGFLIEHHLPWGITRPEKRLMLARTLEKFIPIHYQDIFSAVLIADQWGRISDDETEKKKKALIWLKDFKEVFYTAYGENFVDYKLEENTEKPKKILYLPIGPSGCGKTSYRNKLDDEKESPLQYYSWDQLRLDMYISDQDKIVHPHELYTLAFQRSCDDPEFSQKVQRKFIDLIKLGDDIYVDNTNTSRKRRAFFVQEARRHGYHIVGILFPLSLEELKTRQEGRGDKNIPFAVSYKQYMSIQLPQIGEVDEIKFAEVLK